MLSTPISQTQPGRSSFMRIKLGGILRCATVSTFQTAPIAGCKQKCGLDLSLLLSVSDVWSDDPGYDGAAPPTGVAAAPASPGKGRHRAADNRKARYTGFFFIDLIYTVCYCHKTVTLFSSTTTEYYYYSLYTSMSVRATLRGYIYI